MGEPSGVPFTENQLLVLVDAAWAILSINDGGINSMGCKWNREQIRAAVNSALGILNRPISVEVVDA